MSWSWKTKPRSILKTVRWFPYFAALEGQDWNEKSINVSRKTGQPVHPVRRSYIYAAHRDEDQWLSAVAFEEYLSGQRDVNETEAHGRMDKGAFEFFGFGYVDRGGIIRVTRVGRRIQQGTFDEEDYLKQLLKLRLPNPVYQSGRIKKEQFVFPMQLVLEAMETYGELSRNELALLFGCDTTDQMPLAMDAVGKFREQYAQLRNKNYTAKVKKLFANVYAETYDKIENAVDSYYEYAEAFFRSLLYTGLFTVSGRSIATKIRRAEHSLTKVTMLREQFRFAQPDFHDIDTYMEWFGDPDAVRLPWENPRERRTLIAQKAGMLAERISQEPESATSWQQLSLSDIAQIKEAAEGSSDAAVLKDYEEQLHSDLISYHENYFIHVASRTEEARTQIFQKFQDILDNEDMSALWLEVNTWKSLVAVQGDHFVKRNFRIEEDLSPRSFAPGTGNTPDMELYSGEYVILPEVSLMTGVRQWEHEGSSVIDHVLSFMKKYEDRRVMGIFLSSSLNERTVWQFFVLSRESWMGAPVPVIPLKITQYVELIKHMYEYEWKIDRLIELLEDISQYAGKCMDYREWWAEIPHRIRKWEESGCPVGE